MAQMGYVDDQGNWHEPDNPWASTPPEGDPSPVWDWPANDWQNAPPGPPPGPPTEPPPGPPTGPPPGPPPTTTRPRADYVPGTFTAPGLRGYPSMPGVPNAPSPTLPAWRTPPAFAHDAYTAPTPFAYQDFKAPSVTDALTDPSYQWRKSQGEDTLQRWAATRGTLNDSGTAKALLEYGGNAASQEYGNIWDRGLNTYRTNRGNAFDTYNVNEGNRARTYDTNRAGAVSDYNTNYQTQYTDPYKSAYTQAIDTWQPQMDTWQAGVNQARAGYSGDIGRVTADNADTYNRAYTEYMDREKRDRRRWEDQRDAALAE